MAADRQRREILERLIARVPRTSCCYNKLASALERPHTSFGVHLAVMVEPYLTAIMDGRKTIESRFGVHRNAPYKGIDEGDLIVFKRSGGPVVGIAWAHSAWYYQISEGVLDKLRREFASRLFALDDEFWTARAEKLFATLIEITDPLAVEPFPVSKRDRRGWVTYRGSAFAGEPALI